MKYCTQINPFLCDAFKRKSKKFKLCETHFVRANLSLHLGIYQTLPWLSGHRQRTGNKYQELCVQSLAMTAIFQPQIAKN